MYRYFFLVFVLVAVSCTSEALKSTPTLTQTPTPTPLPVPTPTPSPTPRPGLGISLDDVRDVAESFGFQFKRIDDRMVGEATENVVVALFPPYDDLSEAHLVFYTYADSFDMIPITAFMLLFTTFETGDIEWMIDDLLAGRKAQMNADSVYVQAELDADSRIIVVKFAPRK